MANGKMITINNHSYVTDGAMLLRTTATTVNWNEEYRLGVQTNINMTFSTPPDDISAESVIIFTVGESFSATFTPPNGYTIVGLDNIVYTLGRVYELYFKVINSTTISVLYASTVLNGRLPEDYIELTYIENTNSQYIDTGLINSTDIGVHVEFQSMFTGSDQGMYDIFGAQNTTSPNSYFSLLTQRNGVARIDIETNAGSLRSAFDNNKHIVEMNYYQSGRGLFDGTDKGAVTINNDLGTNYHVALMATNLQGTIQRYGYCRIFECIFTKGTNKVRHFIPAQRVFDGVLGFYDLVTNQFYTNAGTGAFIPGTPIYSRLPSGYTELEFIYANNGPYINTGYAPTSANVDVQIKYLFTSTVSAKTLFGYGNDSTTRYFCLYNHLYLYVGQGQVAQVMTSNPTMVLYDLFVHAEASGSGYYIFNGSRSNFTITNPTTKFADGTFLILDQGSQGAALGRTEYARIYYYRMWENGKLVRDMVPCRRESDGAIGLIDLCSSSSPFDGTSFYGNSGSGVFYPGPVVGYDILIDQLTQNVGTTGTASASQYKSGYAGNAYMAFDNNFNNAADVYYGSAYANSTYIQYIWNTKVSHIDYIFLDGFIDGGGTITTGAIQYTLDGSTWNNAVTLTSSNFTNDSTGIGIGNIYKVNLSNVQGIRVGSTASSNSRGMIVRELCCYGTK